MAHINLETIPNLVKVGSVDIFSKRSFNARPILKKLLNKIKMIKLLHKCMVLVILIHVPLHETEQNAEKGGH